MEVNVTQARVYLDNHTNSIPVWIYRMSLDSPVCEAGAVIGEDDARDWLSSKEALERGGRKGLRDIRLTQ
jgi:hypothetical protein